MNKKLSLYTVLAGSLFLLDRLSKVWALCTCCNAWQVNGYVRCMLAFNRGVSWSFLSFDNPVLFFGLIAVVTCITLFLGLYMWRQYCSGRSILGELLVLVGSASNLLDRVLYGGVVDFIELSYGSWSWPIFNVADVFIVIGVGIMLLQMYRDDK